MDSFSLAMLTIAVLFLYLVIKNINKNKILFEQAFLWIIIALSLIVFSLFESIPNALADAIGFSLTSNFLLSFAVLFLLVTTFLLSIQLSNQKEQTKTLIQEVSMVKQQVDHLQQKEKDHE